VAVESRLRTPAPFRRPIIPLEARRMIVMKFGGTSVEDAKAIDRVASIVQGRL
jgi:hypothetical protein